jgi:PHD/YefM family antitoxin component YafN of YafNO toxin-antitoxin module
MDEEITITTNGRATAVLVSSDEFESWKETVAIQADRDLMREIRKGLRALKSKKLKPLSLDALVK